ncbi:hypothetical protein HY490_03355 [Candidatus Woesearchaeota archaeon]|nr:hypothetical protein [Candidatus Woesearchaeota archaeon]
MQHGRLPARRIAELSGVPVTAVYPHVQHLVCQGLVQVLDGKIQEYEALRPSVCIPALIERRQRELASVREYVNELENMMGNVP